MVGIAHDSNSCNLGGVKVGLCVFFGHALEELIFLPHVQATECGGGPTNRQGWRDKDEDKDKWKLQQQTKYKPSKRRR